MNLSDKTYMRNQAALLLAESLQYIHALHPEFVIDTINKFTSIAEDKTEYSQRMQVRVSVKLSQVAFEAEKALEVLRNGEGAEPTTPFISIKEYENDDERNDGKSSGHGTGHVPDATTTERSRDTVHLSPWGDSGFGDDVEYVYPFICETKGEPSGGDLRIGPRAQRSSQPSNKRVSKFDVEKSRVNTRRGENVQRTNGKDASGTRSLRESVGESSQRIDGQSGSEDSSLGKTTRESGSEESNNSERRGDSKESGFGTRTTLDANPGGNSGRHGRGDERRREARGSEKLEGDEELHTGKSKERHREAGRDPSNHGYEFESEDVGNESEDDGNGSRVHYPILGIFEGRQLRTSVYERRITTRRD